MSIDRTPVVEENFRRFLTSWDGDVEPVESLDAPVVAGSALDGRTALELFESQLTARCLDLEARVLKKKGLGYYTIASAGHEGNVVLGDGLRTTDPSLLHYRSAAFQIQRARKAPGQTPIFDICLSLVASSDDPVAGGRHKVFGSPDLWVPPQTSTIASHLPKSVGMAVALDRFPRLDIEPPVPQDSIVCCTFGDASANHSTAAGAINAALWAAHQHLPVPILFVCEDNGYGISVRTPKGWIETAYGSRPHLEYFQADGLDLPSAWDTAREAIRCCRERRRPVFLHLRTVRLLGHAGSDVELVYRSLKEVEETESRDPLLRTADLLLRRGILTPDEALELLDELRERVGAAAQEAVSRPKLVGREAVERPLAPLDPEAIEEEAARTPAGRADWFDGELPEEDEPRHLAVLLNRALSDALLKYPELLIFGEDVAQKGGVYNVTNGLMKQAGMSRVFNTLLDEQTILGMALGAGMLGLLPVPEIQYLAYLHNAEDQVRGEACSLQFFSRDRFRNPTVIRIASYGYQRGFGGHFHNDSATGFLREVPGLIIASPARGEDAVRMLRTCLAAASVSGRVVAFLEPIALYMIRDLHEEGDGAWQDAYPPPEASIPIGRGRLYNPEAEDLTIISYANGLYYSLRAARRLKEEDGLSARVFDLRWLAPLDTEGILSAARATGRVLIVDEGRRSGGVSEAIGALLAEEAVGTRVERVTAADCYVPLGEAAYDILPAEDDIVEAARALFVPTETG